MVPYEGTLDKVILQDYTSLLVRGLSPNVFVKLWQEDNRQQTRKGGETMEPEDITPVSAGDPLGSALFYGAAIILIALLAFWGLGVLDAKTPIFDQLAKMFH